MEIHGDGSALHSGWGSTLLILLLRLNIPLLRSILTIVLRNKSGQGVGFHRYNINTSSIVKSTNNVFKNVRKYSLIPLLTIIKTADWCNKHRKQTFRGLVDRKLVHLVENFMHVTWVIAEKIIVLELNTFELDTMSSVLTGSHIWCV